MHSATYPVYQHTTRKLRQQILSTLIITAGMLSCHAFAQDNTSPTTDNPQSPDTLTVDNASKHQNTIASKKTQTQRPKIGLALSGGGARGLAHIGVLRELERQHIPIDYIAGTSAGALIGGMYASGLSVDEIEQRVKEMDFDKILFEKQDRRTQIQFTRANEYNGTGMVDVSVTNKGIVALPQSVIKDAKVEEAIRDILKNYPYDVNFNQLPIPFRAVSTDLATGEKVVLSKGKLSEALRASMSIPAVFAPIEIDGRLLTDGMVASNLPINVVRQMGADRIIAVNVGSGLLPKDQIKNVVNVSEQLLSILVERNVTEEVKTLSQNDAYVLVDVGDIANLQFDRINEAIQFGEKAMRQPKTSQKIASFSAPNSEYQQFLVKHENSAPQPEQIVRFIRIETNGIAHPEALRRKIAHREDQALDIQMVNRDIKELMTVDRIASVRYDVVPVGNGYELVYRVQEKDAASNAVHAGLELATSNLTKQTVALHLAHRNVWVNRWGGEWRNNVTLGKNTEIRTLFNQPINYGQNWFIRPQLQLNFDNNLAYLPNQDEASTEYDTTHQKIGFLAGQTLGNIGEWGIGASWQRTHLSGNQTNPNLLINDETKRRFTLDAEVTIDQLDDLYIPTQGLFLRAYGRFSPSKNEGGERYMQAGVQTTWAKRLNPHHSVALGFEAAGHNNKGSVYLSPYHLGGYHRLSGYEQNQFTGNYLALGSITYRYTSPWKLLGNPLVLGTSIEAGNTWEKTSEISGSGLKVSGSLFGTINTPIGPTQLGLGVTRDGKANLYFYLGRSFSDW